MWENIFLNQIELSKGGRNQKSSDKTKFLVFQIQAGLNSDIRKINKTKLIDLGSLGLAKRIDILTNAGLVE